MTGIGRIPLVFIRAPYIAETKGEARAICTVNGHIVTAQQGNQLATDFHPELTADLSLHRYFLSLGQPKEKQDC